MKVDLEGRVALVTGGAGAIGHSIALSLAENGATVAVNDLRDAGTTCDEIQQKGGKAKFFPADISSSAAVDAMVSEIEKDLGAIEILINNAGVNVGKNRVPVHEFPDSEWDRIVSIDLNGTFYCSRAVSGRMVRERSLMIRRGIASGGGAVHCPVSPTACQLLLIAGWDR